MRTRFRAACVRRQAEPQDELSWARLFVLSPAQNDRDCRDRWIVAQLLADLEAAR